LQLTAVGHSFPLPDFELITVNFLIAAGSQALEHSDQVPLQSILKGQAPYPGLQSYFFGQTLPLPSLA
jgi:hypothetical protein